MSVARNSVSETLALELLSAAPLPGLLERFVSLAFRKPKLPAFVFSLDQRLISFRADG